MTDIRSLKFNKALNKSGILNSVVISDHMTKTNYGRYAIVKLGGNEYKCIYTPARYVKFKRVRKGDRYSCFEFTLNIYSDHSTLFINDTSFRCLYIHHSALKYFKSQKKKIDSTGKSYYISYIHIDNKKYVSAVCTETEANIAYYKYMIKRCYSTRLLEISYRHDIYYHGNSMNDCIKTNPFVFAIENLLCDIDRIYELDKFFNHDPIGVKPDTPVKRLTQHRLFDINVKDIIAEYLVCTQKLKV